jgi:hypothetical protein
MILAAADAMALDLARSWVVGDAPRDVAAGKAAGCRTVLIVDPSLAPSPAALEQPTTKPDFVVSTLVEAVELIAKQTNKVPPPTMEAANRPVALQAPAHPVAASQNSISPAMAPTEKPAPSPQTTPVDLSRLELMTQQVVVELRKLNETHHDDFSISKLIAGIMQVLAVSAVMLGYFLYRHDAAYLQSWLLAAIFMQAFTVALLIMSRQK